MVIHTAMAGFCVFWNNKRYTLYINYFSIVIVSSGKIVLSHL